MLQQRLQLITISPMGKLFLSEFLKVLGCIRQKKYFITNGRQKSTIILNFNYRCNGTPSVQWLKAGHLCKKKGIVEEDNQNSVEVEVATQEIVNDSTLAENEVQTEVDKKTEEQERNWQAMRQRDKEKEIALKQKDDELSAMRAVLAQVAQTQKPVQEEEKLDLDEYSTYGGVQKVAKKTIQPLEEKIAHLEGLINKQDENKKITDFRNKYPDFDDVVNVETLDLLQKKEPELAEDIAQSKDPFMMGFRSYKLIKALGLQADVPTSRRVAEVDKKIKQNEKAVQSPQAYDKRPMAKAFKTTAADNKRIYEEMMSFASQA